MWYTKAAGPQRLRARLALGAVGLAGFLTAVIPSIGRDTAAAIAAAAHTATIQIDNFTFTPGDLTVTAGTVVTWKNADDSPHRIADVNGGYTSAALDTEDSYSHTFATPGVYKYICSIHPYMKGEITVKPAAAGS
ncbi:MAG: cupredoxin domain-containing protein [Stellaceae bacterium]